MKPNKYNLTLFFGIVPLYIFTLIHLMGSITNINRIAYSLILVISVFLLFEIVKRVWRTPGSISKHKKLELLEKLSNKQHIQVYKSDYYDDYDLVYRPIEIYSSMWEPKDEVTKIVLSNKTINVHSKEYIKILIDREWNKFTSLATPKIILSLFIPLMLVFNGLIFIFGHRSFLGDWIGYGMSDFIMPFVSLLLLVIVLIGWNKYNSTMEFKLDKKLLDDYSVDEVVRFVKENEKEEGGKQKEKSKQINEMYAQQRINKLIKMKEA